jgi:hypothetical protein
MPFFGLTELCFYKPPSIEVLRGIYESANRTVGRFVHPSVGLPHGFRTIIRVWNEFL